MNYFITGGSGFLGGHLLTKLTALLQPTDKVYVLCRTPMEFSDPRFACVPGDLQRAGEAKTELLDCDYVFHIGGEARFGNHYDYQAHNVAPTEQMIAVLKQSSRLKRFVFTSTIGAFDRSTDDRLYSPITKQSTPRPTSKYGQSKLTCEKIIRESGLPFTIFRPTWIYGKGMRLDSHINAFVSMVVKKPLMARIGFPGKVSVIHVEDMAQALVNTIGNEKSCNKYYFGVTENVSLGEILRSVANRLNGKPPKQIPVPRFAFIVGRIHGLLPLALTNLVADYLCASDPEFLTDLNIPNPILFANGLSDVIASNPLARGYYLITGANSGVGLALARELRNRGERLILVDKNIDTVAPQFASQLVIQADLSDPQAGTAIAKAVQSLPLRCLMNIAGIGFKGDFLQSPAEKSMAMVDVNIKGTLLLTQALKKKLLADKSDIVNIASSVAYYPLPGMSVYAATKAFLANWSEALGVELKGSNRVFTISPSGLKTNFQRSAGVKESGDLISPEKFATLILSDLGGKPKTYLYGARGKLLGLAGRVLPPRMMAALMGRLFAQAR